MHRPTGLSFRVAWRAQPIMRMQRLQVEFFLPRRGSGVTQCGLRCGDTCGDRGSVGDH